MPVHLTRPAAAVALALSVGLLALPACKKKKAPTTPEPPAPAGGNNTPAPTGTARAGGAPQSPVFASSAQAPMRVAAETDMKQIVLALHNHHDAHGTLPGRVRGRDRQAGAELARRHPAEPRTRRTVPAVQARRAVGQRPQQAADRADAQAVRPAEHEHQRVHLPARVQRAAHLAAAGGRAAQGGAGDRRRQAYANPGRRVEHHSGCRSLRPGDLDEAGRVGVHAGQRAQARRGVSPAAR